MRLCPNLMLSGIVRFVSTQIFFVKWAPSCGLGPTDKRGDPLLIRHSHLSTYVLLMSTASIDELKCGGSIGRAETPRAASKVTVTPKPCFHFFPALLGSTRESMMSDGSLHEPQLAAVSWLSALVGADCSEPDYHYSLTRRAKRQVPSPATPPPSSWLSLPGLSPAAGGLSLSLSLLSVGTPGRKVGHVREMRIDRDSSALDPAQLQAGSCTDLQRVERGRQHQKKACSQEWRSPACGKGKDWTAPPGSWLPVQTRRRRSGSPTLANPDREAACLKSTPVPAHAPWPLLPCSLPPSLGPDPCPHSFSCRTGETRIGSTMLKKS